MAARDELLVSDVHIHCTFQEKDGKRTACSRFKIQRTGPATADSTRSDDEGAGLRSPAAPLQTDQDGDLVVARRAGHAEEQCDVVTIDHLAATPLQDVGLQVWRGALLLCDFLVFSSERFDGCCAIELGAGVGLCSIVLGRVARRVFCTDIGVDVLRNCLWNVQMNSHLYKHGESVVKVKEFNWLKPSLPNDISCDGFFWTKEDLRELEDISVVIAADVIYDDLLTDAFLKHVFNLLKGRRATLFLAIEKRLNFTLEALDVACPAYSHFTEALAHNSSLKAKQLAVDFPQFLEYDRVKELELWEIQAM